MKKGVSHNFNSFIDFSISYFEETKMNPLNNEIPDEIIKKRIQPWVVDEDDYRKCVTAAT